nr:MAG TPA: hypothetical protein [Caudoviricetes sp.]
MTELFFLCIRVLTLSRFDFLFDLYYTKGLNQKTYGGIVCGKLILAKLGHLPHNNSCPKARA